MVLISLDQSTVVTGYAVFSGDQLVEHGVIDFHKEDDLSVRAYRMWAAIDELLRDVKPDMLVYEGVSMQNNAQVLIKLGNLQGHITASAWKLGLPFVTYLPSKWRKILEFQQGSKVKRSDLKKQALRFVEETYGVRVREDEAEAIAIGLAYLKEQKEKQNEGNKEECEEEQALPF